MRREETRATQAMPRIQPNMIPAMVPPEIPLFLEELFEVVEFVGEEPEVGLGRTEGSARTWDLAFSSNTHWETLKVRLL